MDPDPSTLHEAVRDSNIGVVRALLALGVNVHEKENNREKRTPLLLVDYCCEKVDETILKLLLKAGANINDQQANNKQTLLHSVASSGNLRILKLLISYNADVHIKSNCGSTPLGLALDHNNLHAAQILINAGADVNSKGSPYFASNGGTALHLAASDNNISIVEYLVSLEAIDVNPRDKLNQTPLHCAAVKNDGTSHLKVIQILLDHGADPYLVDKRGKKPLDHLDKDAVEALKLVSDDHMLDESSFSGKIVSSTRVSDVSNQDEVSETRENLENREKKENDHQLKEMEDGSKNLEAIVFKLEEMENKIKSLEAVVFKLEEMKNKIKSLEAVVFKQGQHCTYKQGYFIIIFCILTLSMMLIILILLSNSIPDEKNNSVIDII